MLHPDGGTVSVACSPRHHNDRALEHHIAKGFVVVDRAAELEVRIARAEREKAAGK